MCQCTVRTDCCHRCRCSSGVPCPCSVAILGFASALLLGSQHDGTLSRHALTVSLTHAPAHLLVPMLPSIARLVLWCHPYDWPNSSTGGAVQLFASERCCVATVTLVPSFGNAGDVVSLRPITVRPFVVAWGCGLTNLFCRRQDRGLMTTDRLLMSVTHMVLCVIVASANYRFRAEHNRRLFEPWLQKTRGAFRRDNGYASWLARQSGIALKPQPRAPSVHG